ncbi:hypothetical protein BD310DRAFT_916688 [Dichomitus squalens]|uniref:Uncharacterized protein n=1 Tax=Dichomitus squalens TaxID=114155 RepID=A0A4Q9Q8N9_9APHY|nr:hypothetical protein BD310DRAFT_916688 [Dichomitus squalens]
MPWLFFNTTSLCLPWKLLSSLFSGECVDSRDIQQLTVTHGLAGLWPRRHPAICSSPQAFSQILCLSLLSAFLETGYIILHKLGAATSSAPQVAGTDRPPFRVHVSFPILPPALVYRIHMVPQRSRRCDRGR